MALTAPAFAATPAPPSANEPSPTPAAATGDSGAKPTGASKGAYLHDGFYLRVSTGIGDYNERFQSRNTARYGGESGGYASGFATMGEISIGYSLRPGFVLGGGLYTVQLMASSFDRNEGVTVPDEVTPDRRNLAVVGPFIDWYPNPRLGFHVHGAAGFSVLGEGWKSRDQSREPEYVAIGGGAVVGVGYDWFIAEQWSLGVMARVTGAVVTGRDDNDVRFFHAVGTSPSLLFTGTYN